MSISSYVDIYVDGADWNGCYGSFVFEAGDGRYQNISFGYDARTHTLNTGSIDYDVLCTYRDTFLADVREAYLANCEALGQLN